jgi:purine-binding chemotaxis protein CheW
MTQSSPNGPQVGGPQVGDELVTVAVGAQQFAIDIMSVREIRGWTESTPLPNAAAHFLGMINLRGLILPVIDLRARLGLGRADVARSSVVVVVQIGARQVGLLVDGVCDILIVREGMIQPTPQVGAGSAANFVQGVMTTDQGIIGLLALDHVVPSEEDQADAA